MHPLLEQYLNEVRRHLQYQPFHIVAAHVRELKENTLDRAQIYEELGFTPEEATIKAARQSDPAILVGKNLFRECPPQHKYVTEVVEACRLRILSLMIFY